jgi:hypothetical protein
MGGIPRMPKVYAWKCSAALRLHDKRGPWVRVGREASTFLRLRTRDGTVLCHRYEGTEDLHIHGSRMKPREQSL